MNKERLNHLITVLTRAKAERKELNMNYWVGVAYNKEDYAPCDTTCCAAGFATLDPVFQSQGLVLGAWRGSKKVIRTLETYNSNRVEHTAPMYRGRYGFDALVDFFEIKQDEAFYIFSRSQYSWNVEPAFSDVIGRIQEVLDKK